MLKREPIYLKTRNDLLQLPSHPRETHESTLGQTKPPSLSLIGEGLDKYNLLLSAKDVLMASGRPNLPKKTATVGTALKRTLMSFKLL